jgi:hypothetical protein
VVLQESVPARWRKVVGRCRPVEVDGERVAPRQGRERGGLPALLRRVLGVSDGGVADDTGGRLPRGAVLVEGPDRGDGPGLVDPSQ